MPDEMSLTPDTAHATADGLWVSGSELAKLKGVTKQTVSEKVARLVADGKIEVRPGKGKAKLINVAAYDRAVGETTDLARAQGAQTKTGAADDSTARDPTFTQHQATRAGYEAELKRLDLEERLGRLRSVEDVEASAIKCGEAVVRIVDDKVLRAEEMAAAVAKDGVAGARRILKDIVFAEREQIAKAFASLAAGDVVETEGTEPPQ